MQINHLINIEIKGNVPPSHIMLDSNTERGMMNAHSLLTAQKLLT